MSSALAKFRKSNKDGDIKKAAQKVADPKKDTLTRLKHLRTVLENYETTEAKKFFEENYSHIYYIFFDNFVAVEADLKQRANKSHREELDNILHIFEKILLLLPELVHKRWMFHSIGRIMKKLLHPGNGLKLRRDGLRLFLIWYQVLQENASLECHQIFLQLVPELGDGIHQDILNCRSPSTPDISVKSSCSSLSSYGGIIAAGEVTPILPVAGEKQPENITKFFFDALLQFMVSEVIKVEWVNKDMREVCFVFLFNKFKQSYLTWLLPDFDRTRSIYDPVLDLPTLRCAANTRNIDEPEDVSECRDSFIRWVTTFTISVKKSDGEIMKGGAPNSLAETEDESRVSSRDIPDHKMDGPELTMPGSNTSTLSANSQCTEKDSPNSSFSSEEHSSSEYEIVRGVLCSTRENINIIHEVFRQAFLFSFKHAGAIRRVIAVYKDWFQHDSENKPVFMLEPPLSDLCLPLGIPLDLCDLSHSLSDILEEDGSTDSMHHKPENMSMRPVWNQIRQRVTRHLIRESAPTSLPLQLSRDSGDLKTWLRNASYLGAIQDLADGGGELSHTDVRAGQQKLIQICVTNAATVFLLKAETESAILEQVDLCKRILNIYRHMVVKINMEQKTWEQILKVLLCITSGVQGEPLTSGVQGEPLEIREDSLGGRLAQPIFQTLIVTWIKANLNVYITTDLWDEFLNVLSSLTSWAELIKEWAKTMETLTRVLARQVYNLDLLDLPLQRLSEQKEKRRRGKSQDIPAKARIDNESFSRAWSKSESQGERPVSSSFTQQTSFERAGKYRSDGAGGKSRSDLSKQRSLSGTPSPSHSRSASASSDLAAMVRSSSEGNLTTPAELADRLKQGISRSPAISRSAGVNKGSSSPHSDREPAGGCRHSGGGDIEDQEVASLVSPAETPCSESIHDAMDISAASSISSERSDTDTVVRRSRSPSPGSVQYRVSGTRTPSPTPSSELTVDHPTHHKDSPTPDRDSLHIDMVASGDQQHRGSLEEFKSVLAGGSCQGWLPDVSVILWRRMLGALGDINSIDDPEIHASVFEHLCDLQDTFFRMRENLGVTVDNQSSPSPPEFIPPQTIFSSWLFECLTLSDKYKRGKLLAYQLLCQMMMRQADVTPPPELLTKFYLVVHQGLTSQDQDVKNVLVKHCGPRFFSTSLTGNSLLIVAFVSACESIISTDSMEAPRLEAMSILGSLVCFPNMFKDTPMLHPDMEKSLMKTDVFKDHIINLLLKAGKSESAGLARCIAVNSLGIYLYEELSHGTLHSKFIEAVNVLLGTLGCKDKKVAKTASDIFRLLCDHVDKLLDFHPDLPKRIVDVMSATISMLIPAAGSSPGAQRLLLEEARLLAAMMHCVVEWCLKIPVPSLLETSESDKGSLYNVFQMLNVAVSGHTATSLATARTWVAELWQDPDFRNLREVSPVARPASSDSLASTASVMSDKSKQATSSTASGTSDKGKQGTSSEAKSGTGDGNKESLLVKLAARLMMNHLVNHLCHFPMGIGASRLSSSVAENYDMPEYSSDDLKSDIFAAPNVQFFVLNQRTLVSYIELPALLDLPGGGVTAGLTTARTVCRVILRDLTGKYCWESSVLYGPPWCPKGSYFQKAKALHDLTVDTELEPLIIQEDSDTCPTLSIQKQRDPSKLPVYETSEDHHDNLYDLLGYVGHTSPECLLMPGVPLNIEGPIPEDLNNNAESMMKDMVIHHMNAELEYYNKHKADARRMDDIHMLAKPQMPSEIQDPMSPFQMCRMLIDQMGLLSWEKRCQFDLLKKTDKLLRELKNLDVQKCRETHKFAVIYVAEGQEDKNSILSNPGGSDAFEHFVSGLGWEVDLETHKGFLGGLQQNKSTGDTAPYYANSMCEILFHVSTRIPSGNEESMHIKIKHLGNDEVHIVWSEHTRDYRRGIIPTEFGDVLIIIYPLPSGLFRIHIDRKPEVQLFGPLFDGAIVDYRVLPELVRATAVNASRVIRSQKQFFHTYYEERNRCLDSVIQNHVEKTIFENFAADVFAPVLPPNSTICESPSDTSISIPSSSSQQEISTNNNHKMSLDSQVSPSTSRQSRGSSESGEKSGESSFMRTARRLSLKSKKSSTSRGAHTPPSSPKWS